MPVYFYTINFSRQELERKRLEEEEKKRKLMEEESRRKAEEAKRQYQSEIERKRVEMTTEKKRLEETLNRIRHQRDQLLQEQEASQAKEFDTRRRRDELAMRVQVHKGSIVKFICHF